MAPPAILPSLQQLTLLRCLPTAGPRLPIGVPLLLSALILSSLIGPAAAQSMRPKDAWQPAYQQLPNFPLENTYINRTTNRPDPNNTLIGRIVRYHVYTKQRPLTYRLDWKLTLADYLNANDIMDPAFYPGHDLLKQNPMDADRAVVSKLTRTQRDALVQTLVSLFTTAPQPVPAKPTPIPRAPATGGGLLK
jgi:hypothetical protein